MIDKNIRENKLLLIAGICMSIYSLIEMSDCLYLVLISLDLVPNIYSDIGINATNDVTFYLEHQPIFLLPFFLAFTGMRISSTIGIFKNRLWGFYIGIISLVITMILTMNFIPFGFLELFFCAILLILLFIGYLGDSTIINQ